MRFFASSHRIDQLSPRTQVLCALFLLGMLFQAVSGVLMHHHGAGWTPTSVSTYYRGDETPAPAPAGDADLEAPDVPLSGGGLRVARSFGTLLEVAHFHLLAMPLVLFVVAHLFSMTPMGRHGWAGVLCYAGFACAFADALSPFAVRYWSALFAPLKLLAFLGVEACLIAMVALTLGTTLGGLRRATRTPQPGLGTEG